MATEFYVKVDGGEFERIGSSEDYEVTIRKKKEEVLEEVQGPTSIDEVIANVVCKIRELERSVDANSDNILRWAEDYTNFKHEQREEIDLVNEDIALLDEKIDEIDAVRYSITKVLKGERVMKDAVQHPNHYTQGKFETIEMIEEITKGYSDGFIAHCVGTAVKYESRAPFKHDDNGLTDLKKARQYLTFAIEYLERKS